VPNSFITESDRSENEAAQAAREKLERLLEGGPLLQEATRLAWLWHGEQTRKGKTTPYLSHLLSVQALVLDAEGTLDEAIAALLHDSLEDADTPEDRAERERTIETRFGTSVLEIVLDCTDTTRNEAGDQKGPWRERKDRYLEQLRQAGPSSLRVAACDKRHNLSDLVTDLRREGPATFDRFSAGAEEQIWYFESLVAICRNAVPPHVTLELDHLLEELTRLVRS
jgi:(p)ppGpp synthase/HD superfamily hydrolase